MNLKIINKNIFVEKLAAKQCNGESNINFLRKKKDINCYS